MKLIPLAPQTTALTGATHKVSIKAADVAALAGASAALAILPPSGTFGAGMFVEVIAHNLITAFDSSADASINSLLAEVGDGGDTDRLLTQTEVALDGTEVLFKAGTGIGMAYSVADTVDVTFTVAGGASPTLAEIDSGEMELYLRVFNLNDFEIVR
jgi:hypothetical protein